MQYKLWRFLIMVLTLIAVGSFKPAQGAQSGETIKFALPGNSMGYLPLFVAVHRGFFKDEGLDIELPSLVPAMAPECAACRRSALSWTGRLRFAPRRAGSAVESDFLWRRQADVLPGGAKRYSIRWPSSRVKNRRQPIRRHF